MDFARGERIELGMRPLVVVAVAPRTDVSVSVFEVSEGVEVSAFVLQRSP